MQNNLGLNVGDILEDLAGGKKPARFIVRSFGFHTPKGSSIPSCYYANTELIGKKGSNLTIYKEDLKYFKICKAIQVAKTSTTRVK